MKYPSLLPRLIEFAYDSKMLVSQLQLNLTTISSVKQLMRSSESIGANYAESQGASSQKEFYRKVHICKMEALETEFWLLLLRKCYPDSEELRKLKDESIEIARIFVSMTHPRKFKKK